MVTARVREHSEHQMSLDSTARSKLATAAVVLTHIVCGASAMGRGSGIFLFALPSPQLPFSTKHQASRHTSWFPLSTAASPPQALSDLLFVAAYSAPGSSQRSCREQRYRSSRGCHTHSQRADRWTQAGAADICASAIVLCTSQNEVPCACQPCSARILIEHTNTRYQHIGV